MLAAGLVFLTVAADCHSQYWNLLSKIKSDKFRNFVAEFTPNLAHFGMMWWAMPRTTLSIVYAIAISFISAGAIHPLNVALGAAFVKLLGARNLVLRILSLVGLGILTLDGQLIEHLLPVPDYNVVNCFANNTFW